MTRPWGKPFWFYVKTGDPDECWEWAGGKSDTGYGNFRGRHAHRCAYEDKVGPIPERAFICHHCDNRLCVNPAHLYAGSPQSNVDDMMRRGRDREGHAAAAAKRRGMRFPEQSGEARPLAKLTWDAVREIRRMYDSGELTNISELGRRYGVSHPVMTRVVRRVGWRE